MSVSHDYDEKAGAAEGHHHEPPSNDRIFAIGMALNFAFVCGEAFYGFSVNSLALLADAGHNLGDVAGLGLAWGAAWLARKGASSRLTYGFGRATIMASLINAVVLLIGVGAIAWEALQRLPHPEPVAAQTVIWVATVGIAVNAGTASMFMAGSQRDLNIRGAFLHMAADAGVALGVVVAAFVMDRTGWLWLDSAVSLVVGLLIAVGTWHLFRQSLDLALDAIPPGIDRDAVEDFLAKIPGVVAVHDLHIWSLSTTSVAMTAHLVNPNARVDDGLLRGLSRALHEKFGIDHSTFQVEKETAGCDLAEIHEVAASAK